MVSVQGVRQAFLSFTEGADSDTGRREAGEEKEGTPPAINVLNALTIERNGNVERSFNFILLSIGNLL